MRYKKIIIAIDDGPLADRVALEGYELGRQLKSEIALVSIVDTTLNLSEGNVTPSELTEIIKGDFRKVHKILIEEKLKDDKVRSFIDEGRPHEAIVRVAREWGADAIVIGTHGRKGLSHFILGSVSEKLLRHWPNPTFVIPAKH